MTTRYWLLLEALAAGLFVIGWLGPLFMLVGGVLVWGAVAGVRRRCRLRRSRRRRG